MRDLHDEVLCSKSALAFKRVHVGIHLHVGTRSDSESDGMGKSGSRVLRRIWTWDVSVRVVEAMVEFIVVYCVVSYWSRKCSSKISRV